MLVLTRKNGTSIVLGDETVDQEGEHIIKFTVLQCSNGEVRIGIDAPSDIKILRGELVKQKETAQ